MRSLITPEFKGELEKFFAKRKNPDLLVTYLFFLEQSLGLQPVVFPQGKTIYESSEDAVSRLEKEGRLWHEAEIRITFSEDAVNEETRKIYICPFSGKVFGDNTHPNPQDAIYDWVSHCKENTERVGGLPVKRFFVSDDPDIIRNYIERRKKPVMKTVYSSVITGKLFNSKENVIKDFKKNHIKPISLVEVQAQNRYEIEEHFLKSIQEMLEESRVNAFIEELADHPEFRPQIQQWMEAAAAADEGEASEAS